MTSLFNVAVCWGGELGNNENGACYEGGHKIGIRIEAGLPFVELLERVRGAIGCEPNEYVSRLLYRYPDMETRTYGLFDILNEETLMMAYQHEGSLPQHFCMELFVEYKADQEEATHSQPPPATQQSSDDEEASEYYSDSEDGANVEAGAIQPYREPYVVALSDLDPMMAHEMDVYNALGREEAEKVIQKGTIFSSKGEVIKAVKKYSILHNKTFRVNDSSTSRWYVTCKKQETQCPWKLRASLQKNSTIWEIVTYAGPHTCMTESLSTDQRHLDSALIAKEVEEMVCQDNMVKVKVLVAHIQSKYNFTPSYRKVWSAKNKTIQALYGRWDESYSRLPYFMNALQASNPGTIVEWQHLNLSTEGSSVLYSSADIFFRVFWAFGPCVKAFKFCRPVLVVDGTFLYGKYKDTLMIASGLDAGNHIIPVGFAIVEGENQWSWAWFLHNIKRHITHTRRICIISDRHNGLLEAMNNNEIWQEGRAIHRYCARHVAANAAKHCKNAAMENVVKQIAGRYEVRKFNKAMDDLKEFHPDCFEYLCTIHPSQWTAAYDGGYRFGIMTTNLAESINGVLKGVRHLPVTALVADTFKRCVAYFCNRRTEYTNDIAQGYQYPLFVRQLLEHRTRRSTFHQVQSFNRETCLFNVYTRSVNHDHIVNLTNTECTCGKFQGFHIPCSHAIAACRDAGVNYTAYIKIWYTLDNCRKAYANEFYPLGDEAYWPQYTGRNLQANSEMLRRIRGRPRSTRFRNEMDWNSGKRTPVICGSCGQTGHNRRSCQRRLR